MWWGDLLSIVPWASGVLISRQLLIAVVVLWSMRSDADADRRKHAIALLRLLRPVVYRRNMDP
jgi:hypothetical protein